MSFQTWFCLDSQLFCVFCSVWQTLTNHEGGVSLKGIKRTLPFSLLRPFPQGQPAICKRLSETKRAEQDTNRTKMEKHVVLFTHTRIKERGYIYYCSKITSH